MRTNDGTVEKKSSYVFEMFRALIVALIITLALVLIAALVIKLFNIPTDYIGIINQVIKGVSIFLSALICLKKKSGGFIRGIILGLTYILLSYVVFSLFNGAFSFGISLLNDVALGAVTGLISGIIAVNLRK